MTERNFRVLLQGKWDEGKMLAVGLDPDLEKIPETMHVGGPHQTIVAFNRAIIDATKDVACAYKPNSAFYEAYGAAGFEALRETIFYIREVAPTIPVILDAKRADIGNTNDGYVGAAFDYLSADAITAHPYLGKEALRPMLEKTEKGVFILCRTSNPGAGEFQDLEAGGEPLYKKVARHVAENWNTGENCGLVVGATYPDELRAVREIAPDMPLLIPGIGAQGGDLKRSVRAGRDADGRGMVIAASRAILYASEGADFADVARRKAEELHGAIREALLE